MHTDVEQAALNIAAAARVAVELSGVKPETALDFAATLAIRDARKAHRSGATGHAMDFKAKIATRILDGVKSDDVRAFALAAVTR